MTVTVETPPESLSDKKLAIAVADYRHLQRAIASAAMVSKALAFQQLRLICPEQTEPNTCSHCPW